MANQTQSNSDDLFNLLDKDLDDIADLPSFKVPDTGVYKLTLGMELKPINEKPAVVAKFTVREVVELADSSIEESARAKAGDKFDVPHILKDKDGKDSEIAWGKLKELCSPLAEWAGNTNLKAIIKKLTEETVDITCKVKRVQRKGTEADPVFDARIDNVTVD
jgi:hypothetical protein